MRLSIKMIVGAAIVAVSVVAGTFAASAPAAAFEQDRARATQTTPDISARKRPTKSNRGTSLRVSRLSRRAAEPPNASRPYYHPVPLFFPFAQDRGYF